MPPLPQTLQRLAVEIEGWIELGAPERALNGLAPLLEHAATRAIALALRVDANVALGRHAEALQDLEAIQQLDHDREWLDLREAWCRKRTGDVAGAARCMERMLTRTPKSAIAHYNLGCYLALLGEKRRALDELALGCGLDPTLRKGLAGEVDLLSLRDEPDFRCLLPTERQDGGP